MKNLPLVSIFIPVYNGECFLRKTIESLLSQTYTNFECLFVDDASTDKSVDIIKAFEEKDRRIKLFKKKHEGNAVASWIFVQSKMEGSFILYSSQDDWFSVDWIEKAVNKMISENLDACVSDVFLYWNENKIKKIKGLYGNHDVVIDGKEAFFRSLSWSISCSAMWRSDIVEKYKFDNFAYNADEFAAREWFLKDCNRVGFCSSIFFIGRLRLQ